MRELLGIGEPAPHPSCARTCYNVREGSVCTHGLRLPP
jgi:hypothetical protein